MGFYENGLDKIAGLGVSLTAMSFGSLPPGVGEASVALAGLAGFVLGKSQKFGPECARVRGRLQKKLLAGYKTLIKVEGDSWSLHADLEAADKALQDCLGDCFIDRSRLAKSAVTPEGFPYGAISIVMKALAEKHSDLFGEGKEDTLAYQYAHDVIKAGVEAAVDNVDYYKQLEPELMFEMAQTLGLILEVVKDTNAVVHEMDARTERIEATTNKLVEVLSPQARDFHIKEGMLIALARKYAEGNPSDFDAAYAGLERALEVAVQERERGKLPANTDDAVNAVIAQVDALNEDGNIDSAATLILEEEERVEAGLVRLYDKGISQAILTRNVEMAVAYELKKLPLEVPHTDDAYTYLRNIFTQWYTRGDKKGLNFDSEVAIALMRYMVTRFSYDRDKKGVCLNHLGVALRVLGERESGPERLEEAVAAHRAALEKQTRDRMPLDWALIQMNLGTALLCLGEREGEIETLVDAVAAYHAALEVRTRERVPLDWAMTQMNLANALAIFGMREGGTKGLEEAVVAYRAALEERTRDRVPLDRANTIGNEAVALKILAERTNDISMANRALDQLVEAEKVLREGGHAAWANTFVNQIPGVEALIMRLQGEE